MTDGVSGTDLKHGGAVMQPSTIHDSLFTTPPKEGRTS